MPALMSWPGRIAPGKVVEGVGMAMDILPTFLGMAGVAALPGIDGRDQAELVMRSGKSAHESVHWLYVNSRAVRKGKWKLIENPPKYAGDPLGQPLEKLWLSNLEQDPQEKKNWASEAPGVVEELRKALPEKLL